MTPKQERFVQEYFIDLNATQAAIRAGYSTKTAGVIGGENLRKPNIAAAIAEARAKVSVKLGIEIEEIVGGLLTEARREGERSSHSARVAAWAALGRHLGMFDQKSQDSEGMDSGALIINIIYPNATLENDCPANID
jgi:phage terminase small subunit